MNFICLFSSCILSLSPGVTDVIIFRAFTCQRPWFTHSLFWISLWFVTESLISIVIWSLIWGLLLYSVWAFSLLQLLFTVTYYFFYKHDPGLRNWYLNIWVITPITVPCFFVSLLHMTYQSWYADCLTRPWSSYRPVVVVTVLPSHLTSTYLAW